MQLMVIGEHLSNNDAQAGGPFRDGMSKMLKAWMRDAGINVRDVGFYNVFPKAAGSMFAFTGAKEYGIPDMKYLAKGHYVRAEHRQDVQKIWDTINHIKPNLVLAMGDVPLWALTSQSGLRSNRGRITTGNAAIPGQKILPVLSMRNIVAEWPLRVHLMADLEKAARELQFPEVRRPRRFIHIKPTLDDLESFYQEYIIPTKELSTDIETKDTMITCIGFAPSKERALVVPFLTEENASGNYWDTPREEYLAWSFVARMLRLTDKISFGQNFQYDMQYLWNRMGIPARNFADDTMLMHHAMQPEMLKGLGFLASIYTDELSWKGMHHHRSDDKTGKKED